MLGKLYDGDEAEYSNEQLNGVIIANDRVYNHKVTRINYTSYDGRRSQDSLNPRTHADFMVMSQEDEEDGVAPHPYWYGRIVGIYHAEVRNIGPNSPDRSVQHMNFLWVRWYGRDLSYRCGFKAKRLPRLGFVDSSDPGAFGFLDPAEIIRGCHIMPAFHYGQTDELLPPSIALQAHEENLDYVYYYAGM